MRMFLNDGWCRLALAMLWVCGLTAGCATRNGMALEGNGSELRQADEAVFLMTVSLDNAYRPSLPLQLTVVHIERNGGQQLEDRINIAVHAPEAKIDLPDPGNHYLVSFRLKPGEYEILGVRAAAGVFPVVAHFFAPLYTALRVQGPGVYYLGQMRATVRERQGDEFRAGPMFPPVHQMVAGASTGTFDVQILDQQARDERLFRSRFEQLRAVPVTAAVLPPFDRTKAQDRWEK